MKNHLITLLALCFPSFLVACSCSYVTNFCETMTPNAKVAGVEVIQTYLQTSTDGPTLQYVDVVVKDVLQGNITEEFLSLLVSDGTSCSNPPLLSNYDPGDLLFVLAERPIGTISPNGYPVFQVAPGCAVYHIFANKGAGTVDYEDFIENLSDCALLTKSFDEKQLRKLIQIAPNPATTDLHIFSNAPLQITANVYAADGRLMLHFNLDQHQSYSTDISDWPKGVYLVSLKAGESRITKRLVKM